MRSYLILISLLGFTAAAPSDPILEQKRDGGILSFKCTGMEDVCQNMCCAANGPRKIGLGLIYDKASTQEKRNRRKAAGCIASGGNHCSKKKLNVAGKSCDEYPFASTKPQNGSPQRISRCVAAGSNNKQGGQISGFVKKLSAGDKFTVGFDKTFTCDATKACAAVGPDTVGPGGAALATDIACDNTDDDGDQTSSSEPSCPKRRDIDWENNRLSKKYLTNTGEVINVPGGASIGQVVSRVVPLNETLWEQQTSSGHPSEFEDDEDLEDFDWLLPNLSVKREYIVEELS